MLGAHRLTALVSIEAVAIVVLTVLVCGLLRSHADILRALHGLGVNLDAAHIGGANPSQLASVALGTTHRGDNSPTMAVDLAGVNPAGDAVQVAVTGVRHDTLLAFLTTGCTACQEFWAAFGTSQVPIPGGARLVAVVHDPSEESLSKLRSLAPPGTTVVMSSAAWDDYDVQVAPYFLYVAGGQGRVIGEGSTTSWPQVLSLVEQARSDAGLGDGRPTRPPTSRPASNDRRREERADAELMAAGIAPGDARLYPSALDTGPPHP